MKNSRQAETEPAPPPDSGPSPGSPRREFAIRCLVVGGLLLGAFVLWRLVMLWLLVFAAILVAIALRSVSNPLQRRLGISPALSLTVTVVGFTLALAVAAAAFGQEISAQIGTLIERLPEARALLLAGLSELGLADQAVEALRNVVLGEIGMQLVGQFASDIASFAVALACTVVGGIYLAAQPAVYLRGLLRLAPPAWRGRVESSLDAIGRALRHWLVGQLVVMAFIGTMTGVGAWLIGLPSALALGLIAGLLEFVPYLGPILTVVPAMILGLTVSPEAAFLMLAWLFAVQQFEGYLVTPLVQKEAVSLPPALSLFSLVAAGLLLGAPGVALALPLAVAAFVGVRTLVLPAIERTGSGPDRGNP